jgi:predicted dehydrogenase
LIAIDALKKGKDVYLEKPLTLTIGEAIALEKVVAKTGRVLATGSQQRSDRRFRLACELVRNGRIGKVTRVECRIGANPKGTFQPSAPPEGLDWDFWLGPCPKVDYVTERCHYQYRWWYEYSGGKLTDWGAHHLDIAQWGLGTDDTGPISVQAIGEAPSGAANSYNCHPTFRVEYTYANGAKVIASDTTLPDTVGDKDTNGILFVGDTGKWIFVSRGKISASDPKLLEEPLKEDSIKLEVSNNHMENFLGCVKSRKKPICHVGVGASSVIICHLGVIALQTGKKLDWDPAKRVFAQEEGNALISRPMRAPWKLEV